MENSGGGRHFRLGGAGAASAVMDNTPSSVLSMVQYTYVRKAAKRPSQVKRGNIVTLHQGRRNRGEL